MCGAHPLRGGGQSHGRGARYERGGKNKTLGHC